MLAVEVVKEVRDRGVELAAVEDRLRFRPAGSLTSELKTELKEHKTEIIELLAEGLPDCSRLDCPCIDCSARAPRHATIQDTGEVLEMARGMFGKIEDPVTPPEPLVQREEHGGPAGDRVRFFKGDWREAEPQNFRVHRPDGAA